MALLTFHASQGSKGRLLAIVIQKHSVGRPAESQKPECFRTAGASLSKAKGVLTASLPFLPVAAV